MAISFRRWLLGKLGAGSGTEVICTELAQALEEYRLRELADKPLVLRWLGLFM